MPMEVVIASEFRERSLPESLKAATVMEYCLPAGKDLSVQDLSAGVDVQVKFFDPLVAITVYPEIGEPPSLAGLSQDTVMSIPEVEA